MAADADHVFLDIECKYIYIYTSLRLTIFINVTAPSFETFCVKDITVKQLNSSATFKLPTVVKN